MKKSLVTVVARHVAREAMKRAGGCPTCGKVIPKKRPRPGPTKFCRCAEGKVIPLPELDAFFM